MVEVFGQLVAMVIVREQTLEERQQLRGQKKRGEVEKEEDNDDDEEEEDEEDEDKRRSRTEGNRWRKEGDEVDEHWERIGITR